MKSHRPKRIENSQNKDTQSIKNGKSHTHTYIQRPTSTNHISLC